MTTAEVLEILERWRKPSYARLHAGEMTADEMRTLQAVLTAIVGEVKDRAAEQGKDWAAGKVK
jgi:hypothetical protein